jgi:hypothetical protein
LKFAAKTRYSQFKVGKQENGQVENSKQSGRLQYEDMILLTLRSCISLTDKPTSLHPSGPSDQT